MERTIIYLCINTDVLKARILHGNQKNVRVVDCYAAVADHSNDSRVQCNVAQCVLELHIHKIATHRITCQYRVDHRQSITAFLVIP